MTDLVRLAEELRASDTSYLRLIELGVGQTDNEAGAVYYLASLERKPGQTDAVRNLDYLVEQGVDVGRLKRELGFADVEYPIEAGGPPTTEEAPVLSEEDAREAEAAYQLAFDAIYSGWDVERKYYLIALEHNPNMRKAWHELRNAAKQAGEYALAERCDEAESILDGGGFIRDPRKHLASR